MAEIRCKQRVSFTIQGEVFFYLEIYTKRGKMGSIWVSNLVGGKHDLERKSPYGPQT
jgi:hypothetical protein